MNDIHKKADELVKLAIKDCCKVSFPPTHLEVVRRVDEYISDFTQGDDYDHLLMSEDVLYHSVPFYSEDTTAVQVAHESLRQLLTAHVQERIIRDLEVITQQASDWQDILNAADNLGIPATYWKWNDYLFLWNLEGSLTKHYTDTSYHINYPNDEKGIAAVVASCPKSLGVPDMNDKEAWRDHFARLNVLLDDIHYYIDAYAADANIIIILKAFEKLKDWYPTYKLSELQDDPEAVKGAIFVVKQHLKDLAYYLDLIEEFPF